MSDIVLLCADGSPLSTRALATGWALLPPTLEPVIVTVLDPPDPTLVTGVGFAGGTMSAETFDELARGLEAEARELVQEVASALGLEGARTVVLRGDPGRQICAYAEEESVRAIVIGSRGRGGFKRALLGSVSDYVVRNAHCPVIVTTPGEDATP